MLTVSVTVEPLCVEPQDAGGNTGAEQVALVPPLLPLQFQLQGPLLLTEVDVPVLHKFIVGALLTSTPLAVPHTPLTGFGVVTPCGVNVA